MASLAPFPGQTDLDISGLVRYVRVELGLAQPEFGALLGVCTSTVSAWENGHKVPRLFQQRLIEGLLLAVERHGSNDWNIERSVRACGPAFALWLVLNKAYRV